MFKKIALAALAVAAGLFILSSTRIGSYGCTAWNRVKSTAKKQVPLEFEIERLRREVSQLVPDMKKNLSSVAEEIVAIENLKEQLVASRDNLGKQKAQVKTMADDLKSGNERIVYRAVSYTRARIAEKLARDVKSCQALEAEIRAKESLLEHKERGLEAAREQLATIRTQRQELEVQIAQLETEIKNVRLAQSRNRFSIDDSRLSHIRQSIQEIRNRLRVEQKTNELLGDFGNDPTIQPERTRSAADVVQDAEAYLRGEQPQQKEEGRASATTDVR